MINMRKIPAEDYKKKKETHHVEADGRAQKVLAAVGVDFEVSRPGKIQQQQQSSSSLDLQP